MRPRRPRDARVVAIVPLFDGGALLRRCVQALLDADGAADVVVVDDGSRDGGADVALALAGDAGGRVRLLRGGANRGFAAACNLGAAHVLASGPAPEVLAFVNQDCVVSRGWMSPLVRALREPGVAVVGSRLLEADGHTLQHAGALVHPSGLTSHVGRGSRDPRAFRERREVDYVCGALLATTPRAWTALGGFDEGYRPAYFEEVDLCRRAQRAGWRVLYVPDSEAVHLEGSSFLGDEALRLRRYHRNRLRFAVRELWSGAGFGGWVRAEACWLRGQRRWRDLAPALRAYASVPRFLSERRRDRRGAPRFPDGPLAGTAVGTR